MWNKDSKPLNFEDLIAELMDLFSKSSIDPAESKKERRVEIFNFIKKMVPGVSGVSGYKKWTADSGLNVQEFDLHAPSLTNHPVILLLRINASFFVILSVLLFLGSRFPTVSIIASVILPIIIIVYCSSNTAIGHSYFYFDRVKKNGMGKVIKGKNLVVKIASEKHKQFGAKIAKLVIIANYDPSGLHLTYGEVIKIIRALGILFTISPVIVILNILAEGTMKYFLITPFIVIILGNMLLSRIILGRNRAVPKNYNAEGSPEKASSEKARNPRMDNGTGISVLLAYIYRLFDTKTAMKWLDVDAVFTDGDGYAYRGLESYLKQNYDALIEYNDVYFLYIRNFRDGLDIMHSEIVNAGNPESPLLSDLIIHHGKRIGDHLTRIYLIENSFTAHLKTGEYGKARSSKGRTAVIRKIKVKWPHFFDDAMPAPIIGRFLKTGRSEIENPSVSRLQYAECAILFDSGRIYKSNGARTTELRGHSDEGMNRSRVISLVEDMIEIIFNLTLSLDIRLKDKIPIRLDD